MNILKKIETFLFKKIPIWFFLMMIIFFFIFAILYGSVLRYHYKGGNLFPFIRNTATFFAEIPENLKNLKFRKSEDQIIIENKEDTPSVLNKHKKLPKFKRFLKEQRDYLLILPRYDGDKKSSVVEVIDPNTFDVLHTYNFDPSEMNKIAQKRADKIFHFQSKEIDDAIIRFDYFNPVILEDGSLVSHSNYAPLFKIDICSNLKWANYNQAFHHSIQLDYNNNIYSPTSMVPYSTMVQEKMGDENGFHDDAITRVDSETGEITFIKSVSEILIENNIYKKNILEIYDPIHLNDIEPVFFDSDYWKKNDLFLSAPRFNIIILYRPSTNKVLKIIKGPFSAQHDVDVISDKEISIFNNNNSVLDNNYSEITIYNFETNQFSKKFNDKLINSNVKTQTQGLSEILNDGSLLIEEQNHGRLILFNKNGEKEWEFVNKDSQNNTYFISWSRIIEDKNHIKILKNNINNKKCAE